MFGVVPKAAVGANGIPPTSSNRVELAVRPLVVRGVRTMLIDAGFGDKTDDDVPPHLRAGSRAGIWITRSPMPASLPTTSTSCSRRTCISITPADSPCATRRAGCGPAFRGRGTSSAAANGKTRRTRMRANRASYLPDDFLPLVEAGVLELVDDDQTIMPGVQRASAPAGNACTIRWCSSSRTGSAPRFRPT